MIYLEITRVAKGEDLIVLAGNVVIALVSVHEDLKVQHTVQ